MSDSVEGETQKGRSYVGVRIMGGFLLGVVALVTGCDRVPALGAAAPNPGETGARQLVRERLKSPASYIEYSNNVIWSGTSSHGYDAYITEVDYEATNGFGGSVRDCKVVAFMMEEPNTGDYLYYENKFMDTCAKNSMFDEEFIVKVMKESNFGL